MLLCQVGGLELLLSNITVPNSCWSNQSSPSQLRLCKIQSQPHTSSVEDPLSVHVSLLVNEDLSWTVFVQGKQVEQSNTPLLSTIPANLDGSSCTQLLTLLDTALLCPGHPDPRYMEMAEHRKGTFIGQDGRVRATFDKRHIIDSSGKIYSSTIRTTACEFLTDGSVCHSCMAFGSTLRSMYYRWSTRTEETSKYTNNRLYNIILKLPAGLIAALSPKLSIYYKIFPYVRLPSLYLYYIESTS